MIRAKDISFQYNNENIIFDRFSLETEESNFFGLIGINGAGKSTFLKLCLGLLHYDTGSIEINSYNIRSHRLEALKNIGILHENPQFPSWVVVHEYLEWLGQLRGFSKTEATRQSNYLIEKLGLEQSRNKYVDQLSAGLTQRFGLAQAIIGIPKVIFLDEPTANLDVQSRYAVLELLHNITEQFETQIVIMSHILTDLERYCDTIAMLHQGEIIYQDTITNILGNHIPRFYGIRIPYDMTLEEVSQLLNDEVEIVSKTQQQLVIKLKEHQNFEAVKVELLQNFIVTPYLSPLEELFIEKTSNYQLFFNNGV